MQKRGTIRILLVACFLTCVMGSVDAAPDYHFEGMPTRPLCLSPSGTRLFVVNAPGSRLSVFDTSSTAHPVPVLIREIHVGLEPIAVAAISEDEAWVVNEVSDAISVVSVSSGVTVATIPCADEPGDIVIAGGKAFVSASRSNTVKIFNVSTRQELATVALAGLYPRALAVNEAGTRIYIASKLSGNRTTLLPAARAPAPPLPTQPGVPPAPSTGLIVLADDSRLSIKPDVADNDVFEINVATHAIVRTVKGVGTINFNLAVRPGGNELWVAATEARNLERFEPVLRGRAVENRVSRILLGTTATVTPFDLNPGLEAIANPTAADQATALAQPTGMAFEPGGQHFWITAFGSDRLARINASTGAVVQRIDLSPQGNSRTKRGPRGLIWQASTNCLQVMNRISNTLMTVDPVTGNVLGEVAVARRDPTSQAVREGRGFLYDARLSSHGTQSCASCHIDGDRDELAWDLGDQNGFMETLTTTLPPLGTTQSIVIHPMKGPLMTQTLRGLEGQAPLHWRGDRPTFSHFNGAFTTLLGGANLSPADMSALQTFVETIRYHPNPNQKLDRSLPATLNGGNPSAGQNTFFNETYQTNLSCVSCHNQPSGGASFIIPALALQQSQPFKVAQLRNVYQKRYFTRSANVVSLSGFGLIHDGQDPDLINFFTRSVFGTFSTDTTRKRNLAAFMECFDTGTAPACGQCLTVTTATLAASSAAWTTLEARAAVGDIDLTVVANINHERRSFLYAPAQQIYLPDRTDSATWTKASLQASLSTGVTLNLLGTIPGTGMKSALDHDENGLLDGNEQLTIPTIHLGNETTLTWSTADPWLVPETTTNLTDPWQTIPNLRTISPSGTNLPMTAPMQPRAFFRLREPCPLTCTLPV